MIKQKRIYTPRQGKLMFCKRCGCKITANSGAKKYCKDCSREKNNEYKKRYVKKKRYEMRKVLGLKCKRCHCDLTDFFKTRKYCPICRIEAINENHVKWREENKKKRLAYEREYYKAHKERHREVARESSRRRNEFALLKK